ncbi:carbohydrate kinase family protein [Candidatus Roizmanbacteria bacterium]|nr:carbohydrate kinase family protein [Candidatus Roizmanbacteria bacterium]
MFDVISIGTATLDVFLECSKLEQQESGNTKHILLPHGAKIEVDSVVFETGGGATNTATTFARQGLKTAVIAKIGSDFPAEKVLQKLKDEHIDTSFVVQDPNDSTDFATIIWQPKVGNVLLINRGEGKLETKDVALDTIQTKWFHLSSTEGNIDIVKEVDTLCHPHDTTRPKISWNPGKRELEQKTLLKELLPCIELLILNRTEMATLFDLDWDNKEAILDNAQTLPAKLILITDGSRGSFFWDGNAWMWSDVFHVERHEATGAGDAYGSGFIAGILKGFSYTQCLKLAAANAASVVTTPSAKQGILNEEQRKEWLQRDLTIKKL